MRKGKTPLERYEDGEDVPVGDLAAQAVGSLITGIVQWVMISVIGIVLLVGTVFILDQMFDL